MLGAVRTVGEQRRKLVGGQLAREWREPHLQPFGRGKLAGNAEPFRLSAGDPHGRAVEFPGDDAHLAADDARVEVRTAVLPAWAESGVVVNALAAHGDSFQDAAASASIIFWMGPAATPLAVMATPMAASAMTVPSHTIVVTGRVYAPTRRAAHSASSTRPQTVLNRISSRRNRGESVDSRSHAAVRRGSPLVMNGLSPADMSGCRSATEPRMANAITLLTIESLAIIARGSPLRKLTAMPARLTASMSAASTFTVCSATSPATARTAGPMLLSARESQRLTPNASRSR